MPLQQFPCAFDIPLFADVDQFLDLCKARIRLWHWNCHKSGRRPIDASFRPDTQQFLRSGVVAINLARNVVVFTNQTWTGLGEACGTRTKNAQTGLVALARNGAREAETVTGDSTGRAKRRTP